MGVGLGAIPASKMRGGGGLRQPTAIFGLVGVVGGWEW